MTGSSKPSEMDLASARERFELLAKATYDAIWDWNLETDAIWWNEGFKVMFGYEDEQTGTSGEFWISCIHPDDRERVHKAIQKVIDSGGTAWADEYRFRMADGNYAPVYDRGYTIRKDGKAVRMIGSMTDLTERSRLRQAQEDSEERYRLALSATGLGTWDFDPVTEQLRWDNRCRELFGVSDGIPVNWDTFVMSIYPDDRQKTIEAVQRSLKLSSGGYYNTEFRTVGLEDGKLRWVRASGQTYFNESGLAYRFIGTILDITEERRKEQALKDVERRFQAAFNNASLGITMIDRDSRFVLVNKAFCELTGYSQEELHNGSYADITHPSDLPANQVAVAQLVNGEQTSFVMDKRYIRKEGQVVWVTVHTTMVYDEQGNQETIFSIVQDITEEMALRQDQQRLLNLVENSVDFMAMSDPDGHLMYLNKAGKTLVGLADEAEIIRKNVADFYPPEHLKKIQYEVLPALLKEGCWSGHVTLRHFETGEAIPGYANAIRIDDPATGKFIGRGFAIRDLRPELRAQQALTESEQFLRNITSASPTALWQSNEHGQITYVNQTWIDWTGQPFKENLGEGWAHAILPEDRQRASEQFIQDLTARRYYEVDFRIRRQDGSIRWCLAAGQPQYQGDDTFVGYVGSCVDITDRLEAERQLRLSEERFRNMITQAPVAIGVLRGSDFVIESANEQILNLVGKPAAVIGKPVLQALPELKGQGFIELLEGVYQTGQPYYGYETLAVLNREGQLTECYINFVYAPIRETDQTISGVIVVATEVTAQVRAKNELEASEKRFRNLVLDAPMATAIYTGEDMTIQLANEAMVRLWGKDASVVNKKLRDALPELDGQPFHELLHTVYTTGTTYQTDEGRADLVVDGVLQSFYFNFTYKPLKDASGKVYAILNMATDVTGLVQAKQQLKETEEQLRGAIELAELGTWSWHIATNQTSFSARMQDWYGLGREVLPLNEALTAIPEKDLGHLTKAVEKATQPGSDGSLEAEYIVVNCQTGQKRIIHAQGQAYFNETGDAYQIAGTARDITVQRMTEQELEKQVQLRTEQLEKLNQSLQQSNGNLQQFAYAASHDLQEPLRKIQSFSGILKDKYGSQLSDGGIDILQRIQTASGRMSSLVKDLLSFSRLTSKQSDYEPVELDPLLTDVLSDLEIVIQETDAQITVDPLPAVWGSSRQLTQLFQNLLSNAIKFHKPDQRPRIHVRGALADRAEIAAIPELSVNQSYACIEVSDQGVGFDEKYLDRIFQIFQRLHAKSEFEGTGVGLALCRKVAENHHGYLTARSQPGAGSTFIAYLPTTDSLAPIVDDSSL